MIAFMFRFTVIFAFLMLIGPVCSRASAVGYTMTVTTAYATADPFPNRLDHAYTASDTGYFQVANNGATTFFGVVGMTAVSVFAGDLSFISDSIVLLPGGSVSIAIPDDGSDVGGFNGPAYFFRPGVQILLNGTMSDGVLTQAVSLLAADADIHSGVSRTDQFGLTSDSFVLQGGDPWGFDSGDDFELSQADGTFVFAQSVPEPGSATILATALFLCVASLRPRSGPGRRRPGIARCSLPPGM
jgi:hypothetical protein